MTNASRRTKAFAPPIELPSVLHQENATAMPLIFRFAVMAETGIA
jgi:hypothetical protein